MDITKILDTNRVILGMRTTNKAEAIEELIDLLKKGGTVDCREAFIKDVWQHEAKGSTGLGNHVAIPYGRSSAVINTTLTIDHTRQDVPWETLDDSGVRCAILFVVRFEDQSTTHIRSLFQATDVLADGGIVEQLLVETNPQRTIDLSSQYAQSDVL